MITTSDELNGTLVDTSTSTTPTLSLLGKGDLDSTKGHSQLSVGTLPLTDKDPPENPQEKDPPPSSSEAEEPNPTSSRVTSDNLPSPRYKETVTTPPPEELEHVTTPPSHSREDSPTDYPPKDNPEAPISSEAGSVIICTNKSHTFHQKDPFSRFLSGHTEDTSDKYKKRHRWLNQKPERRHSVDLEELDKQDSRPYRYVLREARTSLPRPKFYNNYPDAKSVSIEYVGLILQHIVWQILREQEDEDIEHERK